MPIKHEATVALLEIIRTHTSELANLQREARAAQERSEETELQFKSLERRIHKLNDQLEEECTKTRELRAEAKKHEQTLQAEKDSHKETKKMIKRLEREKTAEHKKMLLEREKQLIASDVLAVSDARGEAAEATLKEIMDEFNILRHGNKVLQLSYNKLLKTHHKLLEDKDREQDLAESKAGGQVARAEFIKIKMQLDAILEEKETLAMELASKCELEEKSHGEMMRLRERLEAAEHPGGAAKAEGGQHARVNPAAQSAAGQEADAEDAAMLMMMEPASNDAQGSMVQVTPAAEAADSAMDDGEPVAFMDPSPSPSPAPGGEDLAAMAAAANADYGEMPAPRASRGSRTAALNKVAAKPPSPSNGGEDVEMAAEAEHAVDPALLAVEQPPVRAAAARGRGKATKPKSRGKGSRKRR